MTEPKTSATVLADAKQRSMRTLVQGLGLDLAVATVVVLATAFTDIRWTKEYWVTLGLLLAKTAIQAVVSYFMRLLVPPVKSGL